MKNSLLLLITVIMFSNCKSTFEKPYKKKYILVCDNVDETLISSVENIRSRVVQYLPDSCSDIYVKIFLTTATDSKNEFSAYFSSSSDFEDRENTLLSLIDTLKKHVSNGADYAEKAVINCVGDVLLKEITDTTVSYELVMNTDLVENSGGYSSSVHGNDGWRSGYFRFVKNNGECVPQELNEVKRQLDDPSSALYRAIVMPQNYTGRNWKVHLTYTKKIPTIYSNDAGCDKREIQLFWKSLFNKVGITSSENLGQLDEVPFFKKG